MLDKNYYPMYLYARDFRAAAEKAGAKAFEVALERGEGEVARYSSVLYASAHEEENFRYLERIVKFMLWAYGGYKFYFYCVDEKLIEKLKKYNFGLDIHYGRLTEKNIALLHESGTAVNCWTVDDKKTAEKLAGCCVDYITTNILE